MKAKLFLTVFLLIMGTQVVEAQKIIEVCEFEKVLTLSLNSESVGGVVFVDNSRTYMFDPGLTVVYQSDENYSHNGRLVAFKTDIDCIVYSKDNPEGGWAMIIPKEDVNSFRTTQTKGNVVVLQSIRFTDEKNGWAAGKLETEGIVTGVIFYTENGGKNWVIQYMGGTAMKLNTACFADANKGAVYGSRTIGENNFNIVLYTVDGGTTWEEYNPKSDPRRF